MNIYDINIPDFDVKRICDARDERRGSYRRKYNMKAGKISRSYDTLCSYFNDNKTYKQIGEIYGVSAERIRQIVSRSMRDVIKSYNKSGGTT